jgi:GAF domain
MSDREGSAARLRRIGIDPLAGTGAVSLFAAACDQARADEATLWLTDADGENLIAIHNHGPDSGRIVGFAQPLGRGIISMVLETEQAFCENDMARNTARDSTLDQRLGKSTRAMIAVPFVILGETCGVVSCVRLDSPASAPGDFTGRDLDAFVRGTGFFQQAIESALARLDP